jgi:FAD/FMN-containing dehydrogenase
VKASRSVARVTRFGAQSEVLNVLTFTPDTIEEAAEAVRSGEPLRIQGLGTKSGFGCPVQAGRVLSTRGLSGIVEWRPDDLVVTVRAGTPLGELQAALAEKGQCLPLPPWHDELTFLAAGVPGTVGGLVASRLPTRWDSRTRGVRYWVLGLRVLVATGDVIRCGSSAVKNVAGYDIQKLFTGSWGALGLICEATLRVFPRAMFEEQPTGDSRRPPQGKFVIARTLLSNVNDYVGRVGTIESLVDPETGTAWMRVEGVEPPEPPRDGWLVCCGFGERNFPVLGANFDIMERIKKRFDPRGILNPGVFGTL